MIDSDQLSDWNDLFGNKDGSKIYSSIRAVRNMKVRQYEVFLLSLMRHAKNPKLPRLKKFFKFLENFTFHYTAVSKRPANRLETVYSKFAIDLEKAMTESSEKYITRNAQTVLQNLQTRLREYLPGKEEFYDGFMTLKYSNASRWILGYILDSINDNLSGTKELRVNFEYTNLEHILPQKSEEFWNIPISKSKEYVHNLGNITILDEDLNGKLRNYAAIKKLEGLQKSELKINHHLLSSFDLLNWNSTTIEERQKKLCELSFNEVWKL